MEEIELENGRKLRRESPDHRWAVISAEGNELRRLDTFEDEIVCAAFFAGRNGTHV